MEDNKMKRRSFLQALALGALSARDSGRRKFTPYAEKWEPGPCPYDPYTIETTTTPALQNGTIFEFPLEKPYYEARCKVLPDGFLLALENSKLIT